jgi:hypothetical protein
MSLAPNALTVSLKLLARRLPRGSEFTFHLTPERLKITALRLPVAHRGQGTTVLAEILHLTDEAHLPVQITAAPTGEVGDPHLFALVRWGVRFGFQPVRALYGDVDLVREPQPPQSILHLATQARAAKAHDLTRATFEAWLPVGQRAGLREQGAKDAAAQTWHRLHRSVDAPSVRIEPLRTEEGLRMAPVVEPEAPRRPALRPGRAW